MLFVITTIIISIIIVSLLPVIIIATSPRKCVSRYKRPGRTLQQRQRSLARWTSLPLDILCVCVRAYVCVYARVWNSFPGG